jgi:competence protein ComEA
LDDPRTRQAALVLALLLLARALPCERPPARPAAPAPARGAARLLWGLPLDLNRENVRDFEALPGIGPARALAIVSGRPYCAVPDLDRVPGIGPVTLRRMAGKVEVGEAPAGCHLSQGD